MTESWRFPAALALSVLFGAPALSRLATDPDLLVSAGLHYLAALALSWAGVCAIGRLVEGYAMHNHRMRQDEAGPDTPSAPIQPEATQPAPAQAAPGEAVDPAELSSEPAMS